MQVYFCDRCSARITEGELADGHAFEFGTLKFCETCWESEQVKAVVRRKSGLMAAVMQGGAGASYGSPEGEPRAKAGRSTPGRSSKPVRGAAHHPHRRHPSPKRLRAAEHRAHESDRPNGRHRSPRGERGIAFTLLLFGAAALVTFLVVAGLLLFASNDRPRRSAPDRGRSTRRVSDVGASRTSTSQPGSADRSSM